MSAERCRTWVLLAATAGAILCWSPMTARQTSPFDLVSTSSDPNGLLLNPFWSVQVSNPGTLADPALAEAGPGSLRARASRLGSTTPGSARRVAYQSQATALSG
ncbi:MAG: hypothetical protein WBC51_24395 [Vicinamibacterales bacterium]